jgi:hypothetical protein
MKHPRAVALLKRLGDLGKSGQLLHQRERGVQKIVAVHAFVRRPDVSVRPFATVGQAEFD